jgi:ectoine hydroxylase-related dioxygenase (phytanoyl-CoA dioxygenase family)
LVGPILGREHFPVKGLFFDKNGNTNWKVPWHQDLTIAVKERIDSIGFGPWTVKDGIIHVQAPGEVLEGILTVRIHLDNCTTSNGALRVLPGTHSLGRIRQTDLEGAFAGREEHVCEIGSGGVLLMRPLLIHASSASTNLLHRRVIHLEFASTSLPNGLQWFDQ